ncbi:hypothetical protein U879_12660 [Defluviimonas sp. 20V17]|uniref:Uncharacterized protein n=1 Tax=Allgaiera indica TaxID=765699 RepID=A0AAN4ZYP3_9RHOB|nr:hypothetical protein [Allgaiera indica]KDB03363.1 hypothetical protein U879_12660 [Defluviimonas sp. 20V17]GHE00502.1 hypothetical protein GCM10008024_12260 [Allgaiera indica]SDW60870.1 hypothetical protein SAMN05444006_10590 [Allgaiera indica]
MNPFWLIRLARWARHPPGGRQVVFVIAVVVICLVIVALARSGLWPDWARLHGGWRGGWHRP